MNYQPNNVPTEALCIKVEEMSRALGIGITNAYKLAKSEGFYPAKRIQGRIVINVKLLEKWIGERDNT